MINHVNSTPETEIMCLMVCYLCKIVHLENEGLQLIFFMGNISVNKVKTFQESIHHVHVHVLIYNYF